ncbi:MAG: hypothetical protein V8Q84_01565 [Bilophila sp.]
MPLVISFVFSMLLGVPLFGVIGLASIISTIGMPFPMEFIPQNLYTGMDQFPLIATIGFVMAGFLDGNPPALPAKSLKSLKTP